MLNLVKFQQKDYDLNFLLKFTFDFSLLKEILINLVKSNQDLEQRIKKLEKSEKINDKHIYNLEEKLQIEYTLYETEENNTFTENKNNISNEYHYTDSKGKKIKETEEYANINKEEKTDNKNMKIKRSNSINIYRKDFDNINSYASHQVSPDAIRSILKLIKENSDKISKLEKNTNMKITNSYKTLEKKIKEIDSKNIKEHKIYDEKIKEINDRLCDMNDRIDSLIVKTAPLDTMSMFKDSGNGTVDAAKAMIQILEEKINKRLEFIEKRNKGGELGQDIDMDINPVDKSEIKQKTDELEKMVNQLNKDLDILKQKNINITENISNYEDIIKDLKDLIDKKSNDLLVIIEELSNKLKSGDFVGEKMDDFLKKINAEKQRKTQINKRLSNKKVNKINMQENEELNNIITDLKERIKDLNKKINDVDNNLTTLINNQGQNIGEIKGEVIEIKQDLITKITKDDLKPLNHITEEHSDELKYIQDKISELIDGLQRIQDNNPHFIKRLESLTHEIFELKEKGLKEAPKPVDLSKYIDENKIKELLKPYKKNIDNLMFDKESLYNHIKDIKDEIKYLDTKERVNRLNEELNDKLNEVINKLSKKYLDKIETNKLIKNLDVQIKFLSDNQKNKDADSWILAKQPIGCFNCATCEANIKNLSPQNDYLPWNRYPPGEKQFNHLGQGFSRFLQRINEVGKKDSENDIENNLYSSMTNIKGNKNIIFKINNRDSIKDDFKENMFKYNKKFKLPNVLKKRRKKSSKFEDLPLTDEENDSKSYDSNSPKITKITKKKIIEFSPQILSSTKRKSLVVDTNNTNNKVDFSSQKPGSKLERIKSLPIYENV